jgi:predicted flavoprotein YhiN
MVRLYILLFSLLLVSCSVKKKVAKTESKESIKTETNTIIKHTTQDSTLLNIDTFEIEVIAKDSLKPIEVTLGGVTRTFSNAKSVTIRKKKESLKSSVNASTEVQENKSEESIKEEKSLDKEVKRTNYAFLLPLVFLVIFILLAKKIIKSYISL